MRPSRRSSRGTDAMLGSSLAGAVAGRDAVSSTAVAVGGKGKKRQMDEEDAGMGGGRPTTLPGLLSHLSLATSFLLPLVSDSREQDNSRHFSFATSSPSTSSYPLLFHSSSPSHRPSLARPPPSEHKRTPTLHPHLMENTKKLKRLHNFYRSETLLFPPYSPSHLLPPTPSTSASKGVYVPLLTRQPASYWSSISLSSGTGRSSLMAPSEGIWCGTGTGWSQPPPPLSSIPQTLVLVPMHPLARLGQGTSSAAMTRSGPCIVARGGTGGGGEPPLKSALLAILRTRIAENGGSSKGAEAGLRFRK